MVNHELELQNTFIQIVGSLKRSMTQVMKEQGLDLCPLHFMVMRNIYEVKDSTPNSLAVYFRKDKGQVTRLVNGLVKQALVEKIPNPNDKRSQLLALTAKGQDCYKVLQASDLKMLKGMKAGISDDELAQFVLTGQKMVANLQDDQSSNV